jgi:hypothetical protein
MGAGLAAVGAGGAQATFSSDDFNVAPRVSAMPLMQSGNQEALCRRPAHSPRGRHGEGTPGEGQKSGRGRQGPFVQTVGMGRHDSAIQDWPGTMAVQEYLESREGKDALHSALSRQRLSRSLEDDLRSMVEDAAMKRDRAGEPIRSPGGFVRDVAHKRAVDLVRVEVAERRRFCRPVSGYDIETPAWNVIAIERGFEEFEIADRLRSVRRSLMDPRLRAQPWERSAVANYVAIRAEGRMPGERCPQPRGGTSGHHTAEWAALWYSGERGCFAVGGNEDSPAIRQARSRAMGALDNLLVRLRNQMEVDNV